MRVAELRAEIERRSREAENWEAGAVGEERTAAVLEAVAEPSWFLLHDRLLRPGEAQTNIDHLVVTPGGIFAIDSKNWTGRISVYNDTLFVHRSNGEGSRSQPREWELSTINRTAQRVASVAKHAVTPVLCLSGATTGITAPTTVHGVHVVPLGQLVGWLRGFPAPNLPLDARHIAVELSAHFPPAVGAGLTLAPATAEPHSTEPRRGIARRGTAPHPRGRSHPFRRAVLAVIVLVLFATVGVRLLSKGGDTVSRALVPRTTPATAALPSVSPARLQQLETWRRHAGLYKDHAEPSALPYVPDSALRSWSAACRQQQTELGVFRPAFVKAPDGQLAAVARRYDRATRALLAACVAAHPKLLHRAAAQREAAASDVNARYAVVAGEDPSSPLADRVL